MKVNLKVSKLTQNPLFIKFLNWDKSRFYIQNLIENIYNSFEDDYNKSIVKSLQLTDDYLNNLDKFHSKFIEYLLSSLSGKSVSEEFLYWLNNSFKYIKENVDTYLNDETRNIEIIDSKGRWLEAIICYNFINTFNYFGVEIVKKCPICSKFFAHKGKYAKYCSDNCKEKGMKK